MDFTARIPDHLGVALRARRKKLKLSQAQVATKTGVRQDTVSAIEIRTASSSIMTLYRVLSTLGLELVVREKTPGPKTEW
jgi:HTH-type transcriptional regulator / antitoxin HipB